jgi:hypothetical protein
LIEGTDSGVPAGEIMSDEGNRWLLVELALLAALCSRHVDGERTWGGVNSRG